MVVDGNTGGAVVNIRLRRSIREAYTFNMEAACNILQLALFVIVAGCTVAAMVSQQQLQNHLAVFAQSLGIRADLHAGLRRSGAGSMQRPPLVLNHAHATGSVGGKLRMIAESRHFYADLADKGKKIFLAVYFNGNAVDGHISVLVHITSPLLHGTDMWSRTLRT